MQSREEIQNQLDGIIERIGKARFSKDVDALETLRLERRNLETELDELSAEQGYIERQEQKATKAAHEEAIGGTLAEYDKSEAKYLDTIKKLNTTLERLKSLEDALDIQVKTLIDSGNPIQIIQGVWNELIPAKQKGLQDRFLKAYSRDVLPKSRIQEILDALSFHQNLLITTANRLIVKPAESTRKYVGGGSRTSKLPDAEIPFEKRLDKPFENPSRCFARPLVPKTGLQKKRPTMAAMGG